MNASDMPYETIELALNVHLEKAKVEFQNYKNCQISASAYQAT